MAVETKVLLFCGWQNLNIKRLVCKQLVSLLFLELFSIECRAVLVEPPMTSSLVTQKRKYLQDEKRYAKKENAILLYSEKPFK